MTTKGRELRQNKVQTIQDKFNRAKSLVLVDYVGLTSNKINELRNRLKENGAEGKIEKNTLINIAFDKHENLKEDLKGPTFAIFSYEDAITGIKTLFDFAKENDGNPRVKAGLVEGRYVDETQLETLSKLPGRDQLVAQVVGGLKAPLNGLVGSLSGITRNFVYVLHSISEKKNEEVQK